MLRKDLLVPMLVVAALLWAGGCSDNGELEPSSTAAMTVASTLSSLPPSTTSTAAPEPSSTSSTARPAPSTTAESKGEPAREYVRLPVGSKVVALTFDAAYDPAPLPDILSALEEAGIRGTFFLTGEFAEDFPDSVRSIVAAGHPVGNHSYSHPDFTTIGQEETRRQLSKTAALLEELGTDDPRPLFRAPFGARNDRVLSRLGEEGYVSIYWTIDTVDWKPERTPEQIRRVVLERAEPGAIVLMHVGSRQTADILPTLIAELRAAGYGFVTVLEGLPGG